MAGQLSAPVWVTEPREVLRSTDKDRCPFPVKHLTDPLLLKSERDSTFI